MDKFYDEKFSKFKDKINYLVSGSILSVLYYLNNYKKLKEYETISFSEASNKIDSALMSFVF